MAKNNTGPATSSPWNSGGFAFAANTNTLDQESMPSDKAEAARQKSAAVMEALRNGDQGEADRLMGKDMTGQGQLMPGMGWIKRRAAERSAKKQKRQRDSMTKPDDASIASSGLEKDSVVVDGKMKGEDDGVIR